MRRHKPAEPRWVDRVVVDAVHLDQIRMHGGLGGRMTYLEARSFRGPDRFAAVLTRNLIATGKALDPPCVRLTDAGWVELEVYLSSCPSWRRLCCFLTSPSTLAVHLTSQHHCHRLVQRRTACADVEFPGGARVTERQASVSLERFQVLD